MNRYTQLSYSNFDLPMLQLPFEQLNELVGSFQKSKDEFDALSELIPKYIKDSKSDVELLGQIKSYQNQVVNQLADIAATGDVAEYRRQLTEAKKAIANMWKPGGAANVLEQRYDQEQARIKDVTEFFKDNKLLQERFKKDYTYNDIEYDPDTGGFKSLTGQQYHKYIPEAEITKWATDNIDKLKATYLRQYPGQRRALNDVTTLHEFITVTGVTPDKIADIMLNTLPQEFINSMYQDAATEKYFNPKLPDINPAPYRIEKVNGKNVRVMNLDNPIGRLVQGMMGRAYEEIDIDRIQVKDEVEVERRKKLLEEVKTPPPQFEVHTFQTNNTNVKEYDFKISSDGKIVNEYLIEKIGGQLITPVPGVNVYRALTGKEKSPYTNKTAIEIFRSKEFQKKNPVFKDVYQRWKDDESFKSKSDTDKAKFLQEQANKVIAKMKVNANTYDTPIGDLAVNIKQNEKTKTIGTDGTLGSIGGASIRIVRPDGTISSDVLSIDEVIAEFFGGDNKAFQEATSYMGQMRGSNAFNMPMVGGGQFGAGKVFKSTWKQDGGYMGKDKVKDLWIVVGADSYQAATYRSPIFEMQSPLLDPSKEMSDVIRMEDYIPNTPENSQLIRLIKYTYPEGFRVRRKTVYPEDKVQEEIDRLTETRTVTEENSSGILVERTLSDAELRSRVNSLKAKQKSLKYYSDAEPELDLEIVVPFESDVNDPNYKSGYTPVDNSKADLKRFIGMLETFAKQYDVVDYKSRK